MSKNKKKENKNFHRTKVSVLFTSSAPFMGGAEINLVELLNTLDCSKITIYLLYNPDSKLNEYLKNENIRLFPYYLPEFRRRNFFSVLMTFLKIFYILVKNRINFLYLNTHVDSKYTGVMSRLLHIHSIAHLHMCEDDAALKWMDINRADRIIFPSRSEMETVLIQSPWIERNKCFFVYNGVNSLVYYPHKELGEIKNKISIDGEKPTVGMIGRLISLKGQHLFLEMVSKIQERKIDANFLIVGDDNTPGKKYLKTLIDMAKSLNIEQKVRFLGFRKDIPLIMSLCDLIVVPSLKEPFGRVVIEAMACGTPVVASRVDGLKEIFEDGRGGLYCESNNVDSLTEKVLYFFEHPQWWQEQKKIARDLCLLKYNQEMHTKKIEMLILETMEAKNA